MANQKVTIELLATKGSVELLETIADSLQTHPGLIEYLRDKGFRKPVQDDEIIPIATEVIRFLGSKL